MDTSETYIKMSDCPEIQAKKQCYNMGDYFTKLVLDEYPLCFCRIASMPKTNTIWLPRQDQLQEMVRDKIILRDFHLTQSSKGLWKLSDNEGLRNNELCAMGESMEQLWLAFVMKEKYGKVWNGESWSV